ncbi:MAG: methyltransferase [Clostridia bacterium]|nr:methyltransferase [Clostridia bacterium]
MEENTTEPALPECAEDERIDTVNEQITLIQKRDGLTFGTDAYLLAAFLRPAPRARAVELGAGTGIISLLAATREKLHDTVAVEIQPAFAALCERNVRLNHLTDRIRTLCADVRDLSAETLGYECDLVYSNPPYMRTDAGLPNANVGKNVARHETAGGISEFCAAASRLLKYGGTFAVVYRPDRLPELMAALHAHGLAPKRMTFVAADTKTAPSMVLIESKKDAAPAMTLTPTLLLYRDTPTSGAREMTDAARAVYDTCALYPIQSPKKKNGRPSAVSEEVST